MSSWCRSVVYSSSPIFGVGKIKNYKTYQAIGFFSLFACAVNAQDAGGLNGSISLSQRLSYGTTGGLTSAGDFTAQTDVGLSLASQTRSDSFSLDVGSGLSWNSDDGVNFSDPLFRLSYARESRDSAFTAGLTYRTFDFDSQFSEQTLDGDFTILGAGTRTDATAVVGLEFGRTAPVGGSLNVSHAIRDYEGTIDPDLVDTSTTSINGQVNLAFDPRITGRLTGGWTLVDQPGSGRQTTTSLGAGVSLDVNQTLTTDVSLTYNVVDTEGSATRQGFGLGASFNQTLQNGNLSGNLSTDIGQNGRGTNLSLSRSLALQNGSVSLTAGGSYSDSSGFSPLYGLSYQTELVSGGNLSANLSQNFTTNLDGDEAVNSNLSVNYSQALSRVSSISTGFTFRDNDVTNVSGEDSSRMDLNVSYRQEFAQDWGVVGGFTHSLARQDGSAETSSNTFFVALDKTFAWRQ